MRLVFKANGVEADVPDARTAHAMIASGMFSTAEGEEAPAPPAPDPAQRDTALGQDAVGRGDAPPACVEAVCEPGSGAPPMPPGDLPGADELVALTNAALLAMCAERGVDTTGLRAKRQLIAALTGGEG